MLEKAKISVLVSGGGTNLQALFNAQSSGVLRSGEIVQVISSRADAFALERAKKAGVRADVAERSSFATGVEFEHRLSELLNEVKPDVIVLAGFMHILSPEFVSHPSRKGRMVNVHPALIPSFCGEGFYGLKVHKAVLSSGVKVTGATVHLVTDIPDGGPILAQKAVYILPDDTPEVLQRRVMEQAEWEILPRAVEDLCYSLVSNSFNPEQKPTFTVRGNPYPGRGIILGCTPSGQPALAYFIMGRSAGSRARVFEKSGDDVIIKLLDPSKVNDPSLILYAPLLVHDNKIIVTNGDQTGTIKQFLAQGGTFEDALRTRQFEPDPPHFTPRVSGMITLKNSGSSAKLDFKYNLSILKAGKACSASDEASNNRTCIREFFEYEPVPGVGHIIHTYNGDGKALPSFLGEPREVTIPEDVDTFAESLWDALSHENRVSLYVRIMSNSGNYSDRLINRYTCD